MQTDASNSTITLYILNNVLVTYNTIHCITWSLFKLWWPISLINFQPVTIDIAAQRLILCNLISLSFLRLILHTYSGNEGGGIWFHWKVDPEKEEWIPYVEQLDEYFITNGVEDTTKKRAILLSS